MKGMVEKPAAGTAPSHQAAGGQVVGHQLLRRDGHAQAGHGGQQRGGADEMLKPGDEIEDVQGAVSLLTLMMKFVDAQASGKDDEAGR